MPVATPTEVRIPMPTETPGGLNAMLAAARGQSAPAPAVQAKGPAPAPRTPVDTGRVRSGAGSEDPRGSEPAPGPTPTQGLAALPARSAPSTNLNPSKGSAADSGTRFELDERGNMVPVKEGSDDYAPLDPDKVGFEPEASDTPAAPEVKPETPTEPTPASEAKTDEPPVPFTQTQRDYSAFDPADVEALKKLPNAAFNKFRDTFIEAKKNKEELTQLKQNLSSKPAEPTYLFEHPEAYILQPEFTQHLEAAQQADQLVDFYRTQLGRAHEGQDIQYIDNAGKLVTHPLNGRVDGRVIAAVTAELNRHIQHQHQAKLAVDGFANKYKQAAANVAQEIKHVEDTFFPGFDENKLPPEERQVYDYAFKITPTALRNSPQTRTIAKAYVSFARLHTSASKRIAELEAELAQYKTKQPASPSPTTAATAAEAIIPFAWKD